MPSVAVLSELTSALVSVGIANGCSNHFRVKPVHCRLYLPCVSLKANRIITKIGMNSHRITRCV